MDEYQHLRESADEAPRRVYHGHDAIPAPRPVECSGCIVGAPVGDAHTCEACGPAAAAFDAQMDRFLRQQHAILAYLPGAWDDAERHSEARAGGRHLLAHDRSDDRCDGLAAGDATAVALYEPNVVIVRRVELR